MQPVVIAAAVVGLVALAAAAWAETGEAAMVAAAPIGALGGLALYHAGFGFTGAWRRLLRERRGAGVRAQLLFVAIASVAVAPLFAAGAGLGVEARPWVFPIGAASALGAAMFGLGMQLGGGCGSGVLFTLGGGSTRMVVTLGAFLAGSVIWSGTADLWEGWPTLGAHSLAAALGPAPALLVTLAGLGALAAATAAVERRAHGALESPLAGGSALAGSWLRGPWSRPLGAAALALVVVLCVLTLGRPWGITAAFPLWGAQIADGIGLPIAHWRAWSGGALERSALADATSVMNFGLMLGALAAAGLAGRFAPVARLSLLDLWTAVVGGLLMGYGARLAFGCNIGGFVGGVVSSSAHGWWWLLFAFAGSSVGVAIRARVGLDPRLVFNSETTR